MKKLKLQVQMSIDGYIAGPKGEMDWLTWNWDEKIKDYVKEITEAVDCIVLGRKLAQGFIPHWASIPEGEDAAGVEKMNSTKKVVFTRTQDRSDWDNTVLAKGDLADEINTLKAQPGGDMIPYGGGTFVSALIQEGLIDEYHLFVNPVLLGSGMTIFKGLPTKLGLTLQRSVAFPCGIVLLCYLPTGN